MNPYPNYQILLAGPALVFDKGLGLWLASRGAVIDEVLENPHCLVRPPPEAVPKAIAGTSAGDVFGKLVRMNEGARHQVGKLVIAQALAAVDLAEVAASSARFATRLPCDDITAWLFDLPTYVVADLLGIAHAELSQVALEVAAFVRCLSPLSTPAMLASASTAAQSLHARFAKADDLGSDIRRRAVIAGWRDEEAITANLIGLLSQTHEATAGLIGNSIVTLLTQPNLQQRLRADPSLTAAFVSEVARFDPPVQNTRRFVAQATSVAGVALQPGDVILLLLGATARDEGANPRADQFILEREERKLAGFGGGRHMCPGQAIALAIATGAVRHLLTLPLPLDAATLSWTYAPSANARLPRFTTKGQP